MTQPSTKEYIQHRRREVQREFRREFHRVVASIRQRNPTNKAYTKYHAKLHGTVTTWLLSIQSAIEVAAGAGEPPARQVWHEQPLGFGVTGLESLARRRCHSRDTPLPVHTLISAGQAIEEFLVEVFDLSTPPPVVDEPWKPEEAPSLSELGIDLDKEKTNLDLSR